MNTMGRLTVTTYCSNCGGFTTGVPEDGKNLDRCTECGCYASTDGVCCAQHEVRDSPYPSGTCPRCEQEAQRRAERQHMMTRDPTLEPY
jgi:hypothetical protein